MLKLLPVLLLACSPAFGILQITAATNAAGYMRNGMPSAGLAQGSYVTVFGTDMAPATLAQRGYPLTPATFNGVRLTIVKGSFAYDLHVTYTTPTQIGGILRSDTPLGPAILRLIYNGLSSDLAVTIIARNFGVFTVNQGGSGPAVAYKYASNGASTLVTLFESAAPGQLISLYGTGLGPTSGDDGLPVTVAQDLPGNVEVYIGNKRATVSYKGRIPGISSIDQINVTIPLDVTPGCFVSIVIRTDAISNGSTIPVAPGGRNCSDDNGIRSADLDRARAAGGLNYGQYLLSRSQFTESTGVFTLREVISGRFFRYTLDRLPSAQPYSSVGSCVLFDSPGLISRTPTTSSVTLNGGTTLTVSNSAGSKTLTATGGRYSYSALVNRTPPSTANPTVPEFLVAGVHNLSVNSGTEVAAHSVTMTRPQTFTWTNFSSVNAVNRNQDLELTWSGGDPGGFVQIFGISSSNPVGTTYQSGGFDCVVPSAPGRFVVPAYVLQFLPQTSFLGGEPQSFLTVSFQGRGTFTASGVDTPVALWTLDQGKAIPFN